MNKKHITKEFNILNINSLSNEIGVYAFWLNGKCIYVGKAEKQTLKERLTQHYRNCHNDYLKLWINVYGKRLKFCYLRLNNHKRVGFIERKFIYRLQPMTNKQLI